MINYHFFRQFIGFALIFCSGSAHAAPVTWVASSPNNDMNDPVNWNPNTVPGAGDDAIFNSALPGIDFNPTENSAPFSVSTIQFPFNASAFTINFNNETLTFNGPGISGSNTNAAISVANTDNHSFPGDLVSFLGGTGTSGNAIITVSNNGTVTGSQSGMSVGTFNSNLYSAGAFTITNGEILASNTGVDSTNGIGNNGTANTGSGQLEFTQSFTAGDNVTISASNNGTFSGTNTVQGIAVAIVNGSQFVSSGTFDAGDHFTCEVHNTGNDSSLGVGLSNIGQINAAQMILQDQATVGDNCTIAVSNTGMNSSQTTNFSDFIGYLNDQQFYAGNTFQAGDAFSLTVTNSGVDTSNGNGQYQVAVINSNSGTTGNQILLQHGAMLGDHATISAANSGTYSGTNTNGGSNVGGMNLQQFVIGDFTAPGAYTFVAGDNFTLNASNSGIDSSNGMGGNAVGDVSSDQVTLFTPAIFGDQANIAITNSGNFSGHASTIYVNVGSAGSSQFDCVSSVLAGDHFMLNVSNVATNTGTGIGGYFIGDIITGQQTSFHGGLVLGNNGSITISNSGINSSDTTNNNQVGALLGYGKQLLAQNLFQTGNDFQLRITNSGFDESTGAGGNFVGFINNNTADNSASQFHLSDGGTLGDRASIMLVNTGMYQGSTTNSNSVGTLSGQQMYSANDFFAGNDMNLLVSNAGTDNGSAQNNNNIGTVGSSQLEFSDTIIGNNSSIVLSNSGTNNDPTGTLNNIGVVNGSQLLVNGNFTGGTALNINAGNTAVNEGDPNNFVGSVAGSQITFTQECSLNDGTVISAFNSGTVGSSQILFGQGFDIISGSVVIEAINQGTVGSFGIDIQGSNAGGNAFIHLGNSTLNIGTFLSSFTIAGLDGDSTSIVQSQPQLVIDTAPSTRSVFSGTIQNYLSHSSTLVKTGKGTQTLSGNNTYTGLTTIQEGVLVLNGMVAGDLLINSAGTLKGNGTVGGRLTNNGVISPGESIGTITAGDYINNDGTYAVEVNGLGQSDLIDVLGTATLNGGTVLLSSSDGGFTFQQPYTILTAGEGVTGTFSGVASSAFVKPTLGYDPNNVYLTLQSALVNAAKKCNQCGVAKNLDHIINPNAAQSQLISTIANLPLTAAQKALESLSGFQYTNDVLMANISTGRFLRRLYDPLRSLVSPSSCDSSCGVPCNGWTTWLDTGYGFTNLHGDNAHKLHCDSYQVTCGIQKQFCYDLTLGVAGSYEHDNTRYRDGKANGNTGYAAVYGLYRPCMFYGLFDFVYGHTSNRLKRTIDAGYLHEKTRGKPNINNFTFYGEAGFDLPIDCLLVQPFIGIQAGRNWRGRIDENQETNWGLLIDKYHWSTTRSRLGLHFSTSNFYDCIDASLDVAWNQLLSSHKNSTVGRFKQFGNDFPVCGDKLDRCSFDYALELTASLCDGLKGYVELNGEFWQHASTINVIGGVELSW